MHVLPVIVLLIWLIPSAIRSEDIECRHVSCYEHLHQICWRGKCLNSFPCGSKRCYGHSTCRNNECSCIRGWRSPEQHCTNRDYLCKIGGCVHGNCYDDPYKCKCDLPTSFTGKSCDLAPTKENWCKKYHNYDADRLLLVHAPQFARYCAIDRYGPVKELLKVNDMLVEDAYQSQGYFLWDLHPVVKKFCCFETKSFLIGKKMREFFTGNRETRYNLFQHYFSSNKNYVKEAKKVCKADKTEPMCVLVYALPLVNQILALPRGDAYYPYTEDDKFYEELVLMHASYLAQTHPDLSALKDIRAKSVKDTVKKAVDRIYKFVQSNNIEALKKFMERLPPAYVFTQLATNSRCKATDENCYFLKILVQVDHYMKEINYHMQPKDKRMQVFLNTETNYVAFLEAKQLDRILEVLDEQKLTSLTTANELKKFITQKFGQVKSYFKHVAGFNDAIATADIGYISGRLVTFQNQVKSIVGIFRKKMVSLIAQMLTGAALDLAQAIITMAIAIAEACNPLGAILGGSSATSIASAAADVAHAFAQIAKGARVVDSWTKIQNQGNIISYKFQQNDDFLKNVKQLVNDEYTTREEFRKAKDSFLAQYNDYDPKVLPDDLTKIGTSWKSLVTAACEVIEDFVTLAGIAIAGAIKAQGLCLDLPVLADRMTALYEEIYDFQFDLMDALAESMKAKVSKDAAEEITTEFTSIIEHKTIPTVSTLHLVGSLTYMTYKAQMLQAINQYCNILEYKKGGTMPMQCKGSKTDISELVSISLSECVCQTFEYYYVPTHPKNSKDKAFVDMTKLFAGEPVTFKIPNSQWLIDHGWIEERERNTVFVVKKFEVFLPVSSDHFPTHIHVKTDSTANVLIPGKTKYTITSSPALYSEYIIGPSRIKCLSKKIPNPYTACQGENANSFICPLTEINPLILYPSLYSQWSIQVKGADGLMQPNPTANISIIFGMQLCDVKVDENRNMVTKGNRKRVSSNCCPKGQYRSSADHDSKCLPCPKYSCSALAGYYCQQF